MGKYLEGLSYGQSGGPWPLSWGRRGTPSLDWQRENEPGPGTYTFAVSRGGVELGKITFQASSLRHAQRISQQNEEAMGGTYNSFVSYEGDFPGT